MSEVDWDGDDSARGMIPLPHWSYVIPAFNEAKRLSDSLAELRDYVSMQGDIVEVIVVDDGSSDATVAVVHEWMRRWPLLRLVEGPHRGKGGAVKAGILAARGEYVALADADFAMPAKEFARFTPQILEHYDVAIGSREAPGAQRFDEPRYRHLMGRIFNKLVKVLLIPNIQDTQCGFKVIRREVAADLCRFQTINGWGFDVELLKIAQLHGYQICEVPIPWRYMSGSRVNPVRDTLGMVREILRIRANARAGRYSQTRSASPATLVEMQDTLALSNQMDARLGEPMRDNVSDPL